MRNSQRVKSEVRCVMQLSGKTALVTGSGSGIGRAIALRFAAAGAIVIVTDVQETGIDVARETDGIFLQADLSSLDATRELGRRALQAAGQIDILVNNAGLQRVAPVDKFPDTDWIKLIQIMLNAPFQLTKTVLPGMKERGWGRIINLASIHGLVASPYKSAYIAAKHGLVGLTKVTALEAGAYGVTVNAICPGYVNTQLVQDQVSAQARTLNLPESEVIREVMLEPMAIKRLVEPEEVARIALFLASADAQSITGASLTIDGGWTAR